MTTYVTRQKPPSGKGPRLYELLDPSGKVIDEGHRPGPLRKKARGLVAEAKKARGSASLPPARNVTSRPAAAQESEE